MWLSSGSEAVVKADQRSVPAEGSREGCGVEGAPKASATTGDVARTFVFAAVVIERSKTCERRGLLSADAAELWHSDNQGKRSTLANTRNAHHEVKSNSQIAVIAQLLGNEAQLRQSSDLKPRNVGENHSFQSRFANMLEAGLEASDILLDLLDEGQAVGKSGEPPIWPNLMWFDCGRACGDQSRVERIILGPLAVKARKRPHLDRLEDQNDKTCRLQMADYATLIATGRLDSDPFDARLRQVRAQLLPTAH